MIIDELLKVSDKASYYEIFKKMKSNQIDIELYILTKIFYYYVLKSKKYQKFIEIRDTFKEYDYSNRRLKKVPLKIARIKDKNSLKSALIIDNIKSLVEYYKEDEDIINN